ncbi:MAG TPA: glycosyltransferase [Cyclobacteriaceae bacterium]|jgi:teichuronic acid biosynthesis glycosyltransferase TuaH|nr:glycosyltransferase [Cyclobacteriaceae bacterium]HRE68772.1 glycosyltransferase [Cyclobacteriaceae bacterium]HRF33578.1 glycosyltransferase [Cyclobacteriaceae bacterium]
MKQFDAIVIITGSRWDQDYSSASISLARELSKTQLVFFIDNPFSWKDVIRGWNTPSIRRRVKALLFGKEIYRAIEPENKNWIAVTPLVNIPINWLPEGYLYQVFSKINNWIFYKTLRRLIREKNLKRFILFNSYNPFYGYELPPDVKPLVNIYQSRDNIRESEYVKKHGPRLEQIAARNAEIRLATSTDLVDKLTAPQYPFWFFPNAADVDLFNKAMVRNESEKQDLATLKRPIIGYMGNICLRVDYDLLLKVAQKYAHATLLMVGPRNDKHQHTIDFTRLQNITFVGPKNIKELPDYLAFMDCTILPFKVNDLTRSIYPLKINEYLAGGKPVVSTSFSPDINGFSPLVYISNSHEEFLNNIDKALTEDSQERIQERMAVAKKNSWVERGKEFLELIDNQIKGNN